MPKRTTQTAESAQARTPRGRKPRPPGEKPPVSTNGATQSVRELRSQARRQAILSAALDEFSAAGFAATRLDDVARRAGVAKGTIYLYFADKETLFQELARSMLSPMVGNIEMLASIDLPFPMLADRLADAFIANIVETRRKDVIRLILTEGPRFPSLAEFYHREVLSRVLAALRSLLSRACERGELRHKALIEFPQLLVAPGLVAILWNSLFQNIAPIDARTLLKAHLDILLDRGSAA